MKKRNNLKELIAGFLDYYAVIVREDESIDYVELMMDTHFCIEYEGVEYYIPENHMMYTEDDELLVNMLRDSFETGGL